MRVAVTGQNGQVASSLAARAPRAGHEIVVLARPAVNLANPASVRAAIAQARPDVIVNAAAYTAVDKAETDEAEAFTVNERGAGAVAAAAAELGVPLLHLSTDYVFDGRGSEPYVETDPTGPLGVYGRSKLAGERAVMAAHGGNSAVLRTAWVYSPYGANFVKTMLRLAESREELGVVADQIGNPTSALAIADGLLALAERLHRDSDPALRGVFHMTAAGEASWAEFAEQIFAGSADLGGPAATVRRITTAEFPTPVRRPANSRLNSDKLFAAYGVRLPQWRTSLDEVMAMLLKQPK